MFFTMPIVIRGVEHNAAVTVYHSAGTDFNIDSSSREPNDPEESEIESIEVNGTPLKGKQFAQHEPECMDHFMRNFESIKQANEIQRDGVDIDQLIELFESLPENQDMDVTKWYFDDHGDDPYQNSDTRKVFKGFLMGIKATEGMR